MRLPSRKFITWIGQEFALQHEQFFLWMPVFASLGIALYFSLRFEPPLQAGIGGVCASLFFIWIFRRHHAFRLTGIFLLLAAGGFSAAQIRTDLVYAPLLQKKIGPVDVTGTITSIDILEEGKGGRYVLSGLEIEHLPANRTPASVRISIRKNENLRVGQRIKVLAALHPPSPPIMPGAFDFQRYMYFQRIGAMGFAFKAPEIISKAAAGTRDSIVETMRNKVDRRVDQILGPKQAPIAKALITGKRAAIHKEDDQAIKNSGLYHILSISGLHIALFATVIFFSTRLLMACIPYLALRHPIKKYAALLGFAGALGYTMLAGAEIPALRSLLMLGAAFLAIMLDRDPFSPRLLSFAALAILLCAPESLLSISFQMSFAAVAAMIFFYDAQHDFISGLYNKAGWFRKILLYFLGIAMTTILATLATAPFTIFHFQNLSLYGLIANAAAIPLVGFVIMPAAVLSLFLMPVGLSAWPLKIVGLGVEGMLWISYKVSTLPHAMLVFSAIPFTAFALAISAILFMLLWQGRLKILGLLPLLAACGILYGYRQPDVIIAPKMAIAALRSKDFLLVSNLRKERFTRENWERMAGFRAGSSQGWPVEGTIGDLACDNHACRWMHEDIKVSFLKNPESFAAECVWADLILSFRPLPDRKCHARVIDKFDVHHNGAYAIRIKSGHIGIEAVEEKRGHRPWNSNL